MISQMFKENGMEWCRTSKLEGKRRKSTYLMEHQRGRAKYAYHATNPQAGPRRKQNPTFDAAPRRTAMTERSAKRRSSAARAPNFPSTNTRKILSLNMDIRIKEASNSEQLITSNQSINQPTNQSINQFVSYQSINQPNNQTINQSINRSIG